MRRRLRMHVDAVPKIHMHRTPVRCVLKGVSERIRDEIGLPPPAQHNDTPNPINIDCEEQPKRLFHMNTYYVLI